MGQFNRIFGASGTNHSEGVVPDPGSATGNTRFLREDRSWSVPPGSGGGSTLIQEINLPGSNPSSLDFQNIPQTYRHLEAWAISSSSPAQNNSFWRMWFNNDQTQNYYWGYLADPGTGSLIERYPVNYDTVAQILEVGDNAGEAGAGYSMLHLWIPYYYAPWNAGVFYQAEVTVWNSQFTVSRGFYLSASGVSRITLGCNAGRAIASLYGIS